jgi:hypothetical protein
MVMEEMLDPFVWHSDRRHGPFRNCCLRPRDRAVREADDFHLATDLAADDTANTDARRAVLAQEAKAVGVLHNTPPYPPGRSGPWDHSVAATVSGSSASSSPTTCGSRPPCRGRSARPVCRSAGRSGREWGVRGAWRGLRSGSDGQMALRFGKAGSITDAVEIRILPNFLPHLGGGRVGIAGAHAVKDAVKIMIG